MFNPKHCWTLAARSLAPFIPSWRTSRPPKAPGFCLPRQEFLSRWLKQGQKLEWPLGREPEGSRWGPEERDGGRASPLEAVEERDEIHEVDLPFRVTNQQVD